MKISTTDSSSLLLLLLLFGADEESLHVSEERHHVRHQRLQVKELFSYANTSSGILLHTARYLPGGGGEEGRGSGGGGRGGVPRQGFSRESVIHAVRNSIVFFMQTHSDVAFRLVGIARAADRLSLPLLSPLLHLPRPVLLLQLSFISSDSACATVLVLVFRLLSAPDSFILGAVRASDSHRLQRSSA